MCFDHDKHFDELFATLSKDRTAVFLYQIIGEEEEKYRVDHLYKNQPAQEVYTLFLIENEWYYRVFETGTKELVKYDLAVFIKETRETFCD